MIIKRAHINDLEAILQILEDARCGFKEQGIDQWQRGYPNRDVVKQDIEKQQSYLVFCEGSLCGTFVVTFEHEHNYDIITDGNWRFSGPYAVIHRIAILRSARGRGCARFCMEYIDELVRKADYHVIRCDTHDANQSMKKLLTQNGFVHCGTIQVPDGARNAYEKSI